MIAFFLLHFPAKLEEHKKVSSLLGQSRAKLFNRDNPRLPLQMSQVFDEAKQELTGNLLISSKSC